MPSSTTWPERRRHPNGYAVLALRLVFVRRLVVLPVVAGAELADPAAEVPERLGQLAGDDPHLVRLALRDLREHLQVLIRKELRIGVPLVNRLEDGVDGLRLPSASSIIPFRWSSARRIALCFSPSAVSTCDCFTPSAVRIAARLSRSARICFSIESLIDIGGSTAFSSTRLTRMPHLPVASSRTPRSWPLIWSREVRVSSSAIPPITLRSVVTVSCSMPWM